MRVFYTFVQHWTHVIQMQEALMHEVSDEVVKLVANTRRLNVGASMVKRFRSEYGPTSFGEELLTELRRESSIRPTQQDEPRQDLYTLWKWYWVG